MPHLLTDRVSDYAAFMPIAGSPACPGVKTYDILVKLPGQGTWDHGVTVHSASVAWACMNYIRRDKPGILVRVLGR